MSLLFNMVDVASMRNPSCLLYRPGQSGYEDLPVPEITHPTDVILKMAFVGVCGSDVRGSFPMRKNGCTDINDFTGPHLASWRYKEHGD